jgi:cell division protein FtsW (lipid II flippase)
MSAADVIKAVVLAPFCAVKRLVADADTRAVIVVVLAQIAVITGASWRYGVVGGLSAAALCVFAWVGGALGAWALAPKDGAK